MRNILLAIVLMFAVVNTGFAANKLPNAYKNYDEAYQAAVEQNRRVFIMFTASWCEPCNITKREALYKPEIWRPLNKYFIVHFVDIEVETKTVQMFSKAKLYTGNIPTMYFLDKGAKNIKGRHIGQFSSPQEFNEWYKFVHKLD